MLSVWLVFSIIGHTVFHGAVHRDDGEKEAQASTILGVTKAFAKPTCSVEDIKKVVKDAQDVIIHYCEGRLVVMGKLKPVLNDVCFSIVICGKSEWDGGV